MILDEQVCTPVQGKTIAELGITVQSTFSHCLNKNFNHHIDESPYQILLTNLCLGLDMGTILAPAFNVSELASFLPARIQYEGRDFFLKMHKGKNGWYIEYLTNKGDVVVTPDGDFATPQDALFMTYRSDYNMAKAMASYLILLLKNQLIDLNEINS